MTQGRQTAGSSDSKRKLITIGAMVVVLGVIIWQVMGLFGGGDTPPPPPTPAKPAPSAAMGMQPVPGGAPQGMPQQAPPAAPVLSAREQELMQLQQQTEAKYLAALNELQMLRIEKEIAQVNKDIASARLDTITSQKEVVDLLTPPAPPQNYAGALANPTTSGAMEPGGGQGGMTMGQPEVTYTVISVTQLESKWNAVLGYKGTLYQVSVGDLIPADSSKVISIDKAGVTLEKDGSQKRISMVPII